MNQPSGARAARTCADCRQSMRLTGSPDDEAAELPEAVALADPPPAVHALRHGCGDALGGDQQRRQAAPSASARRARARPNETISQDARPGGRSPLPAPRRRRARKSSAPCDGAAPAAPAPPHRPGWGPAGHRSSARARHASISACAARGPGPQATWRRTVSSSAGLRPAAAHQATGSRPPPSRPPARGGSAPARPISSSARQRLDRPAPRLRRWWRAASSARRPGPGS